MPRSTINIDAALKMEDIYKKKNVKSYIFCRLPTQDEVVRVRMDTTTHIQLHQHMLDSRALIEKTNGKIILVSIFFFWNFNVAMYYFVCFGVGSNICCTLTYVWPNVLYEFIK